jgi:N-methylhydantoinase A
MGGTSFDVCLITEGCIPISTTNRVHGWSLIAPSIDMNTIGAGGGSIAWADVAGGIHVGPHSSGAVPGPACYMRGGQEATTTDADVILGYINPDYFLGGEMKLSLNKAEEVIGKLASKVRLSPLETAAGIFRIANSNMLEAMRLSTVGQGYDPRDYTLVVFGGAGAVHVPAFASELEIKRIIVPRDASAFSAVGLVVSDTRFDFVKNISRIQGISLDELKDEYAVLQKQGAELLKKSLIEPENMYFRYQADMRFPGEHGQFTVDIPPKITSIEEINKIFIDYHQKMYEYAEEITPKIVNIRMSAIGMMPKPKIAMTELGSENCEGAIKATREAFFHEVGKNISTPIYDGLKMEPGNKLVGPAVIELPTTTIVVRPKQSLFVDKLFSFNINC